MKFTICFAKPSQTSQFTRGIAIHCWPENGPVKIFPLKNIHTYIHKYKGLSPTQVLEEVPEDNCRFLEESGFEIFMAGLVRFYHIEVSKTLELLR